MSACRSARVHIPFDLQEASCDVHSRSPIDRGINVSEAISHLFFPSSRWVAAAANSPRLTRARYPLSIRIYPGKNGPALAHLNRVRWVGTRRHSGWHHKLRMCLYMNYPATGRSRLHRNRRYHPIGPGRSHPRSHPMRHPAAGAPAHQ